MHLTKTLHPPGGAAALIAVIGGDAVTHYEPGDNENAPNVRLTISEFVALLTRHIAKEYMG